MPRPLTTHQRNVLRLKANGHTGAEIADRMGISTVTVNKTLARIYRTLGVRNDVQAATVALAVGELGVHEIEIPAKQRNRIT